ncbi:GGDEF domain-containing protein [Marinimicrobium alkaliphilum]|uniref:GGDEF domain-containing protein n=1 Tax=Marinimicrobium alkaliphilum TaxID=2202654 RepID=UPI000DBA8955|nr:sensor domain-containing diguanylate cyclase [Marinimicrobium alkaliphilum]
MHDFVDQLAIAITESDDLETLVRPLLELLQAVTGLESTYLTSIDFDTSVQNIVFARNTKALTIPEGLSVPWEDTLCKRALETNQRLTDDVSGCWGDSNAARELGLTTYLSEPINIGENKLYGTLCGASRDKVHVQPEAQRILSMFASLIARQIERDQLLETLRQENKVYSEYALTDPLTGIPNRRAFQNELQRALAHAERNQAEVHLAFIDLDGFKRINDQYGHDAGDRFLIQIAKKLKSELRDCDFVARYGGDEFVVFGSTSTGDQEISRQAIRERLEVITKGEFNIGATRLAYAGASVGVVTSAPGERDCDALIRRADEAMYCIKRAKSQRLASKDN